MLAAQILVGAAAKHALLGALAPGAVWRKHDGYNFRRMLAFVNEIPLSHTFIEAIRGSPWINALGRLRGTRSASACSSTAWPSTTTTCRRSATARSSRATPPSSATWVRPHRAHPRCRTLQSARPELGCDTCAIASTCMQLGLGNEGCGVDLGRHQVARHL